MTDTPDTEALVASMRANLLLVSGSSVVSTSDDLWNTIADTLEAQSKELAEAQAEIERLREALVYYADRGGYSDKPIKGRPFQFDAAKCVRDGGRVARAALNKDKTDDRS